VKIRRSNPAVTQVPIQPPTRGEPCGFVCGLELAIRYSVPYLEGSHDPDMMSEVVPRFQPFERCCMVILFCGRPRSARGTCLRACLTLAQPRDDVKTAPPQSPRRPAVSARGTCLRACLPLAQLRDDVTTALPPSPRSSSDSVSRGETALKNTHNVRCSPITLSFFL